MWRGPPSLAQLPGRCRRTRPSAPRPPTGEAGRRWRLWAARARTVRLVPGEPFAGSCSACPRACACLFVAKHRACVWSGMRGRPHEQGCLLTLSRLFCGWGEKGRAHASLCAPS